MHIRQYRAQPLLSQLLALAPCAPAACLQNGAVEFEEFAAAMIGQEEDEETERQLREMQDVFALFDVDGSGQLSANEVGVAAATAWHEPAWTPASVGGMPGGRPHVRAHRRAAGQAGGQAGVPQHGGGLLCPPQPQLQRALKILGVSMSREEVELLMREIDADGDGEVGAAAASARAQLPVLLACTLPCHPPCCCCMCRGTSRPACRFARAFAAGGSTQHSWA